MRSTSLRAALTAFLSLAVILATLLAGLSWATAAPAKGGSPKKPRVTSTATVTASTTPTTSSTFATSSTATSSTAAPTATTSTATPTATAGTATPTATASTATPTATASTATPTATASTAPAPTAPRFGMSYGERLSRMSQADLDAALDDAVALGLGWVRADLSWTTIQGGGATSWNWSGFDRVVLAADARGLQVLPILAYTPAWARDSGCTRFSCPPRDPAQFAAFAAAAVDRYSPYGVHTWEVWNEPNLNQFWPSPDAARYATLLSTTSAAIKKGDPRATVLFGGLAALENSPPSIGPRQFLDAVCRAGACTSADALSYHPYTYPYPASYVADFSAWSKMSTTSISLRSILAGFGLGTMPIWVTEYGAPTDGDGTAVDGTWASLTSTSTHVTEDWQATIARDAVEMADADPSVQSFFWYTNQDLAATTRREASFGLRHLDGTAKPSWQAFRDAVAAAKAG